MATPTMKFRALQIDDQIPEIIIKEHLLILISRNRPKKYNNNVQPAQWYIGSIQPKWRIHQRHNIFLLNK